MEGVKKIGDWAKVENLIKNFGSEMESSKKLYLKRWGLAAEGKAKKHISKQDLPWAPLSKAYLQEKNEKGLSDNIYVATNTYFKNITSLATDDAAFAGVKRVAQHPSGGSLINIAEKMEFGSKSEHVPARPLWRPVFSEMGRWAKKKGNKVTDILIKKIQKYT